MEIGGLTLRVSDLFSILSEDSFVSFRVSYVISPDFKISTNQLQHCTHNRFSTSAWKCGSWRQ